MLLWTENFQWVICVSFKNFRGCPTMVHNLPRPSSSRRALLAPRVCLSGRCTAFECWHPRGRWTTRAQQLHAGGTRAAGWVMPPVGPHGCRPLAPGAGVPAIRCLLTVAGHGADPWLSLPRVASTNQPVTCVSQPGCCSDRQGIDLNIGSKPFCRIFIFNLTDCLLARIIKIRFSVL